MPPIDPTDITVRKAEPSDRDTLIAFTIEEAREAEARTLAPALARQSVEGAFQPQPVVRYWLATAKDHPIASASVTLEWSDWNAAFYWLLQSVYVTPEARGSGTVTALLEAIHQAARDERAAELRLLVHRDNARAIGAYRRAGFEDLPYLVMRRRLS